jgi:hypothetical protein
MKDSPVVAGAVAVAAGAAAVADSAAAVAVGDSVAVRQVAGFPAAAGLLPARVAAAVVLREAVDVLRVAAGVLRAAVSTAGRPSALLAEGDPTSALVNDHRSVREVRDRESGSCRPLAWEEAIDRGSDLASARVVAPGLAPVSGRGSVPALGPGIVRRRCRVSAAEQVWEVEIAPRTCPRRARTASATCRTAWPTPATA